MEMGKKKERKKRDGLKGNKKEGKKETLSTIF